MEGQVLSRVGASWVHRAAPIKIRSASLRAITRSRIQPQRTARGRCEAQPPHDHAPLPQVRVCAYRVTITGWRGPPLADRSLRRLCELRARGLGPRQGHRFRAAGAGPHNLLRSPQSSAWAAVGPRVGESPQCGPGDRHPDRATRARQHAAIRARTRHHPSDARSVFFPSRR
jgi:hypothetical protein